MPNRGPITLIILFLVALSSLRAQSGLALNYDDPLHRGDRAADGTNLWTVASLHADTAVAFGDGGIFQFTGNGGQQWTVTPAVDSVSSILLGTTMIDSLTICTVGWDGVILLSTDLGVTWAKQSVDTLLPLFAVAFADRNRGIIAADSGSIFRTSDGGVSWTRQYGGTSKPYLAVSFTGDSSWTIVGGGGIIIHSTNDGITWSAQTSGITNYLYGVSFPDSMNGTIVGTIGTILHTTDAGAHWNKQSNPDSLEYFFGISFSNDLDGMAVGTNGYIIRTTDGGVTWKDLVSRTTNSLYAVVYKDTATWIAVGGWGTIVLGSDTGAVVSAVPRTPRTLPDRPSLSQNYPNPFNPSTIIEYYIPSEAEVSLKVFDILGREISTLVAGRMEAGLHNVVWAPGRCASGMYYFRLDVRGNQNSNNATITKKLLFLR